ncbi:radical SAM protein [Brachyspira pulli]|uniref:radical SAM protein n=1 Tax=Brachyspira pulli TaxID=310721 RepID=UPI0030067C31
MENFEMKDVISHGLLNMNKILRVNWEITSHCNYKCSYCFGNAGMKNPEFYSFEELKKIASKIFEIERDYYNILLIGGEPTIHPNFLDLLKYFNDLNKQISLSIVTNGSRSIEYHKKLFESIKNKELLFNISIHLEQANLQHIKDIIKLANEYNIYVVLSFMLHPEKEDLLEEFLLEFIELRKNFYFDIMFMELRQAPLFDRNDERYTDRHYQWIDSAKNRWGEAVENSKVKKIEYFSGIPINGYNIIKDGQTINNIELDYGISIRNGLKSFSGFYCFGGSNFIDIHPNGTYSGAIQCPKFANMGSLLNDNLNFKFDICDQYQCGCNSNDIIPKFRDIKDASNFINDNIKYFQPFLIKKIIEPNTQTQNIHNNAIINDNIVKLDNNINELNNKINKLINKIAWWIPVKKWRDNFRNKILY